MTREQILKRVYILAAIIFFSMIPVYYFTVMKALNWEEWIPILLFLAVGILCLVNYFIIHMEQSQKNRE